MKHEQMITNNLVVKLADTVDDAPTYQDDTTMLKINECIVVKGGMASGYSTVDLQMTDAAGNKFSVMATGNIIKTVADFIKANEK